MHLDLAGKCLDDTGNSSANGTKIQIWSCNGGSSQNWTIAQDQTLRIHDRCLSVAGSGTANGSKTVLATCSGAASQQWRVGTAAALVNLVSGLCLDDTGSAAANGIAVRSGHAHGKANQKWTLPAGPVLSQIPGRCLDDAGNGNQLRQPGRDLAVQRGAAQAWTAEPDGTVRTTACAWTSTTRGTASGSGLDLCRLQRHRRPAVDDPHRWRRCRAAESRIRAGV